MTQMKDTNPKDAVGVRKWRQFSVVPLQIVWELGVAMLEGALKYGRHNYRASGVRASVYYDAARGHIDAWFEGQDDDPDTCLSHITKAMASLAVLRDAQMNDFLEDDRPPKVDVEGHAKRLQGIVDSMFEKHADKNPHHYTHREDGAPYLKTDALFVMPEVDFGDAPSSSAWEDLLVESLKMTTADLEIGKTYQLVELWNGNKPAQEGGIWTIVAKDTAPDSGEVVAVRGVKDGWIDHPGIALSMGSKWIELVDVWNASDADFEDQEILGTASILRFPQDSEVGRIIEMRWPWQDVDKNNVIDLTLKANPDWQIKSIEHGAADTKVEFQKVGVDHGPDFIMQVWEADKSHYLHATQTNWPMTFPDGASKVEIVLSRQDVGRLKEVMDKNPDWFISREFHRDHNSEFDFKRRRPA